MATGAWAHNFPASKDAHPTYANYPNAGYDTIIAAFFHSIFTALDAIQDALGYDITGGYADLETRLVDMLFHDRGDPAAPDFNAAALTFDGGPHDLDLSGIVGAQKCWVCIRYDYKETAAGKTFLIQTKGNTNWINIDVIITQVANVAVTGSVFVYTDSAGKAEYTGQAAPPTWLLLTVAGWDI